MRAQTAPNASTHVISKLACPLVGRSQTIRFLDESLVHYVYGRGEVTEQFVCNYGGNPAFRQSIEDGGLEISGVDGDGEVRAVEMSGHPFYVGTLYQSQINSSPEKPHPLIVSFLRAVLEFSFSVNKK